MKRVTIEPTFESWQAAARELLRERMAPTDVEWHEAAPGQAPAAASTGGPGVARVPRQFVDVARQVATLRDPARWTVLYDVLWRLVHESPELLKHGTDPQVRRVFAMAAQARHEADRLEVPEMPGAASFVPAGAGLAELGQAATRCAGCELYRHATQTVFGQGPTDARVALVGEQPGDQEDRRGAPFVGPAGEILDRALAEVGLARERLYVTNAVKHFKFVLRGKRRIHQTPRSGEIAACRPWLEAELSVVKPEIVVALGATAARALLGPDFRLMKEHGRFVPTQWAPKTIATLHPSAVLRGEDDAAQAGLYRMLVEDLRRVANTA